MSSQFANFVELLKYRAQEQPDQTVFTFIQDEDTELESLTYRQLDQQAQKIAAKLQSLNAQGQRALLLYQPSLEYIAAFCGCLYAGVIAVPAYPPRANKSLDRLEAIINDAQAAIALTSSTIKSTIANKLTINCLATDELSLNLATDWQPVHLTPDNLAFLQYTSGSTGNPKGVMISHGNLLHNSHLINLCFQDTPASRGVSWLPPYHDMGLIGGILQPIYVGAAMVLMSPVTFLQRPYRWLKTISKYQATTSGGPNFAYDLCLNQITPEQKASLDLSHWQLAFSGAEPVRHDTLEKFAAAFAECGFKKEAFYPCYGMAETTLIVSGGQKNAFPVVKEVAITGLQENKVLPPSENNSTTLVGCGQTIATQTIVIVNPTPLGKGGSRGDITLSPPLERGERGICADNEIGEIWVQGASVTQGYWQKPELTRYTYDNYVGEQGLFLRTGDLGFVADGELFVTGRLKDLIIIRGRNYYPQDIELTVEKAHPAIREGCCAAFAVEMAGEEKLVVVAEIQRTYLRKLNPSEVSEQIRREIALEHELQVSEIVLLKTGSIPKTSSGKIRRHACKEEFLAASLNVVGDWKKPQTHQQPKVNYPTETIEAWLVEQIAQRLGLASQLIDVHEPFASYGLDSLQAVRLTADLEDWLKIRISPTLAYDYPTIASLARYLRGQSDQTLYTPTHNFKSEDIAIVGLGCRFPGADNYQEFWQILREGKSMTSPVPSERWQGEQWGAFVSEVDKFDAQFFGISPREAAYMDPQQRLLLEVVWSALEDAAIAPDSLKQTDTGVFVGMSSSDYSQLQVKYGVPVNAYGGTGNAHSIAANRLSYVFDLRGPSLAVDTACSSSLVAVHLACNALRQGESSLAIAAGVNLLLAPELTETFTQAGMMAADGNCKTFDESADGYVRGEGCGVVILKRLSDAVADGDRLYGVIKGSAINQDGRSNGLTAPNGISQEEVIRQALNNAQISSQELDYLETHGTGTPLGDPIEVNSLQRVLNPRSTPCYLGSVKTNIGHLEAAAGIAGLIKVVLSLQNEQIPPHLNFTKLNPLIDLGDTLAIATQPQPWTKKTSPRLAGVSSFGFGGTNAHVIIGDPEYPPQPPLGRGELFTLSGKTEAALKANVKNYVKYLTDNPDLCLGDVCLTSNLGRSHFQYRLAVVANNTLDIVKHLSSYLAGNKKTKTLFNKGYNASKLAFLYTGQGSQYLRMGIKLYSEYEIFAQAIDHCAAILADYLDRPLLEIITSEPELLDETIYTQPAIFAVEYALGKLWQHWGIEPNILIGHSVGEYVAAVFARVFSLEDGLKLIAARGRLMQELTNRGEMLAVFASENEVNNAIAGLEDTISIAALNGDRNIVISGDSCDIQTVINNLEKAGIKYKNLQVSHAFHSPLMAKILPEFRQVAAQIKYYLPKLDIISNLTGKLAGAEIATPEYWVNHISQPVQFAQGMNTLYQQGYTNFIEIGAKPILLGMARQNHSGEKGLYLPSLRPPKDETKQMLNSLANLYVHGYKINWQNLTHGLTYQKVPLPTYAFQRERYWFEENNISVKVRQAKSSLNYDWLYQIQWMKQDNFQQITSRNTGNWLILADRDGVGQKLAQQLEKNGATCQLLYQNQTNLDLRKYLTSDIIGIIYLWSLDIRDNQLTNLEKPLESLLTILQTNISAKLWLITKNALNTSINQLSLQGSFWGLAKVIGLEYPEIWRSIIDIDDNITPQLLLAEIINYQQEDQIILRENGRFVPRLTPAQITPQQQITIKPNVTYLITGGLGDLGLKLTSYLIDQGAKNLVLLSRSQPTATSQKFLDQLINQGIKVVIKQVDITDSLQLETVFQEIQTTLPPLKGVFHLAGVLQDGLLANQSWAKFSSVMSPKVTGGWNLHTLTKDLELDLFVMFSSIASLVGSPGQGNYAMANAFLDNLASYRQSLGLPAISINWGAINVGMAAKNNLGVRGLELIDVNQGFELLLDLFRANLPQIGVLDVDWFLLQQQFPVISPYFEQVISSPPTPLNKEEDTTVFNLLLEKSPVEIEKFLREYLQKNIAEILQLDQEKLSVTDSLLDVGMDSLMVMEAINLVKTDLKLMIYPREFYERPKITQLAKYLAGEFTKIASLNRAEGGGIAPLTKGDWGDQKPQSLELIFPSKTAENTEVIEQIEEPIAFILSSPRAGSTLLRVMLAGHPQLFAPPELHLLPFENMQQREEELSISYLGEGLAKALMELKQISPEASEKLVQQLRSDNVSIPDVYRMLQSLVGSKLLIDKSPTYSYQKATLEKSIHLFKNAKYINLIRHPYSVIESFARLRMDKLLTNQEVNPYLLGESIWRASNQNARELAAKIDPSNYHEVRYEDLVTQPQQVMMEICAFLGVEFNEAVLQPYQGDRLTTGLYNQSWSVGDPNFLKHRQIDPKLAQNWQKIQLPSQLSPDTVELAQQFGYELPHESEGGITEMEETYLDVRGLQLCLCTWGPVNGPVVLCLHGILEQGAAWLDVAVKLAQKGYRVVAPDLRGHGKSDHVGKGGSYNLIDFLGDIDAIASNLTNKPFTLVGHSLGSVVAAMFASIRPQNIAKLVLVETILPTESDEAIAENLANHLDYLASPPKHQIFPDIESAAERLRLATPALSAKKALKLAQRILEPCQGGFRWRWASILLTRAGIGFNGISKNKYLGLLKCLTVPITLIYGNRSNFNRPEDLAEQEQAMPNAHKIIISGGHNLHLESGEKLAEIISLN